MELKTFEHNTELIFTLCYDTLELGIDVASGKIDTKNRLSPLNSENLCSKIEIF